MSERNAAVVQHKAELQATHDQRTGRLTAALEAERAEHAAGLEAVDAAVESRARELTAAIAREFLEATRPAVLALVNEPTRAAGRALRDELATLEARCKKELAEPVALDLIIVAFMEVIAADEATLAASAGGSRPYAFSSLVIEAAGRLRNAADGPPLMTAVAALEVAVRASLRTNTNDPIAFRARLEARRTHAGGRRLSVRLEDVEREARAATAAPVVSPSRELLPSFLTSPTG